MSRHFVRSQAPRALALVGAALVAASAAEAAADNPYDRQQQQLAQRAIARGRSAAGIIPLLRLWNNWDAASPEVTRAQLERIVASRRIAPARRAYAAALLARADLREGDPKASDEAIAALGYVTEWRVGGPFDNEGKGGFKRELPPEAVRSDPVDLDVKWPGKERPVGWRDYPGLAHYGFVSLHTLMSPAQNACAFAETFVHAERQRPLTVWVGAGGAVKVWWNGEAVLSDDTYRHPDPDRHVAMVGARRGANRVLVKVCNTEGDWGFYMRLGDRQGGPAEGLRVVSSPPADDGHDSGGAPDNLPGAPEAPLEVLQRAAHGDRARAADRERLARYLVLTGADDPAERRAAQLAARAAEDEPTAERLLLAAQTAEQRGDVMRFVERARELAPEDPEVLLARAQVRATGLTPEEALPILEQLPEGRVEWMRGQLLRGDILRELDLAESAMRAVQAIAERAPEAPRWVREHAEAARAAGRTDLEVELRRRAVEARHDDFGSRRSLLADALHRGEDERALAQLDVLHGLATSTRELRYVAQMHDALDRQAEALETLQQAHDLAPHDAGVLVAQGRLLLRMGQPDVAADALNRALALRPQDAGTRELLEQIQPKQRADESYAVARDALLERRVKDGSGYPATVLQNLTVNTVYENGLGASFRQVAVQIHDDEAARQWRTYSMQYDPGSQRVQVKHARVYRNGRVLEANRTLERQLGQPWYRMYYDSRALVVVFPRLEPGDVVELRYRIDDVAHRNLFADYFGDLHLLRDFSPQKRHDYVLITPRKRQLYLNEPGLEGLQHERRTEDGRRIDHYWAEDVPAIREADSMPGITEISPYLHVSTYRTWEQVGQWYWGLIEDQLHTDESLRRTVRELVEDAPDVRTKVERIHNWVVRNTRYVALEFGIHGYKPYRVPLVVRRGFGDCKDKASLMYAMFREAGIDAEIVLVRTRRNGRIEDLPASLAVFDHAIAYVPELDLYLDGTAEHNGTRELPPQDQGATALHVTAEGSKLRRTPVLPPERHKRSRRLDIHLAPDGSARVDVEGELVGPQAATYRKRYQAAGTRQERFERSMRAVFPGLQLEQLSFDELDSLEHPVRYSYRARVPQMAHRKGDRLRLAPSVLDDLVRELARTASREAPLDLGHTRAYVEERAVHLPAGLQVVGRPESDTIESDFGRLQLEVEGEGREIRIRTEFELRADRVPADRYRDFRLWVERADRVLRQRLMIGKAAR